MHYNFAACILPVERLKMLRREKLDIFSFKVEVLEIISLFCVSSLLEELIHWLIKSACVVCLFLCLHK